MEAIEVPTLEIGIAGRANELCMVAETFAITNTETLGGAADLVRQLKAAWQMAEDERDAYVRPLFTAEREYNDQFKVVQRPLKAAETALKNLMKTFQFQQKELQREAEKEQRKELAAAQAAAQADAAERNEPPPPAPPPPPPPPKPGPVRGEYGSKATLRQKWVFEVSDITVVPLKFLMVDSRAVNKAIAEGAREIRGLRIYDEGQVAVS